MTATNALTHQEILARFKENHPELDTVWKITNQYREEQGFVSHYGSQLAGGDREARRVYRTAVLHRERSVLLWANLRDASSPYLGQTLFQNLPTELPATFLERQESVPRYERLFGNLDIVDCDHHRSIFGPAAYLVDLMRFVEQYITLENQGVPATCTLESRRPDLARIRLDAGNTNDLIPYIDLVNELLEAFVGGSVDDGMDAYGLLHDSVFPMSLPFDLPLTESRLYLESFDTSLYDLLNTFRRFMSSRDLASNGEFDRLLVRESLGLSAKEAALIVSNIPDTELFARLAQLYDMELGGGKDLLTGSDTIEGDGLDSVAVFLLRTALSRTQLNELLFLDLDRHEINAGLTRLMFINNVDDGLGHLDVVTVAGNAGGPGEAGQERLVNLSAQKLDRIHRFLRLARKLDWSFAELDLVLRSLARPHVAETALRFDGVNDHVLCGPFAAPGDESEQFLPMDDSFTIEAWIEPARGGRQAILSRGSHEVAQSRFLLWIDAHDRLALRTETAGGTRIDLHSVRPITANVFTHIALVVSKPEGTVRFVIDGQLDNGMHVSPTPVAEGDTLEFGRDLNALFFAGVIKDVRIWAEARQPEDIARDRFRRHALFQSLPKVPNLIGYWPLIETVNGSLTDLSGRGNHGRAGGHEFVTQPHWVRRDLVLDPLPAVSTESRSRDDYLPVPETTGPLLPEQPFATRAVVLDLDGENDVIVIKNQRNHGLGRLDRWTLEFWFNATEKAKRANRRQLLFTQGDAEAGVCVYLHQHVLHVLQWCDDFSGGNFQSSWLKLDSAIVFGTWHHLAITHNEFPDASRSPPVDVIEFEATLDDVALVTADGNTSAPGFRLSPVGPACLGGLASGSVSAFEQGPTTAGDEDEHFFGGQIAELRLWRIVRSTDAGRRERIVAARPSDDLLAYLPLDEGEGWMVADPAVQRHGNRYAGTLQQRQIVLQSTRIDPELCAIHTHFTKPEALEWKNYVYSGRLRISSTNDAIGITFLSRQTDGIDQYYRISRDARQPTFRLLAFPTGVQTVRGLPSDKDWTDSGVRPEIDVWYRFKVAVEDDGSRTTVRASFWPDVEDEPVEFQIDAYDEDPDIRLTTGTVGVWTDGLGEKARQFDNLCTWPIEIDEAGPADRWLDINFEDEKQIPDPAHWRDSGERIIALGDSRLFSRLEKDEASRRVLWGTDSALTNIHATYLNPDVASIDWRDYTYTGQMRIADPAGGIGVTFLVRLNTDNDRGKEIQQYYSLCRDADQPAFHLAAHPHGVQPLQGVLPVESGESGIVPQAGTWYRFCVETHADPELDRTRIRAKVWAMGSDAPTAFTMIAEDHSGIRLEAGTVGVWATGPGAKHFDRLAVVDKLLLTESFDTYAPGQHPDGWRDTDSKNSRDEKSDLFKTALVGDSPVFGTDSTAKNIHSHYAVPGSLYWSNYRFTGRIYMSDPKSGIGVTFLSRYPDDSVESGQHDFYYRLRRYADDPEFHLSPHRGNGKAGDDFIKGKARTTINPRPDTWYRFHIDVEDSGDRTRIRANVWPESSPEPGGFQIDAYDDTPDRLTTGTVGLWTDDRGAKYLDDVKVVQGLLLDGGDGAESFRDSPSRIVYEPDDTLFTAVDEQENALRWLSLDTFPLLRHPLGEHALHFNGERQALVGSFDSALSVGDFTLEVWVRPVWAAPMAQSANPIVGLVGTTDDGTQRIQLGVNSEGRPVLQVGAMTWVAPISLPSASPKTPFVHLAVRVEGMTVSLLVDGQDVSGEGIEEGARPSLPAPLALQLTGIELGRGADDHHFDGSIKDVRLWSTAMTIEQVATGRYQRPDAASSALFGYWPLGEERPDPVHGLGVMSTDLYPVVPDDSMPIGIALGETGFWRASRLVLGFDGDQVLQHELPDAVPGDRHQRTVEVFFQVRDTGISRRKQVIFQEGDHQRGLVLYVYDGALYFVGYNAPDDESRWLTSHEENWQSFATERQRVWRLKTHRIESGRWHHAALVLDGRDEVRPFSLRAFVDGKSVLAGPGSRLWQHTGNFTLGGVAGSVRFHDYDASEPASFDSATTLSSGHTLDGAILYLRLWNVARSAEQIAEGWNRDMDETQEGLVLAWDFDELDGTRIVDASDLGRDGVIDRLARLHSLRDSLQETSVYGFAPLILDDDVLKNIASIKQLKDDRKQSVEQLTALWSELEHTGRNDNTPYFDQVFNAQGAAADIWRSHADRPIRWDRTGMEDRDGDRSTRSRLMQALQLTSQDLDALVAYLSGEEIIVELDTRYLTSLYRLARLPRLLRTSVVELLVLLDSLGRRSMDSLVDVISLNDLARGLQRNGISIAELIFFGKPVATEHASLYAESDLYNLAKRLGEQIDDLLIGSEAFVTTIITESQSLAIVEFLIRFGRLEAIPTSVTSASEPSKNKARVRAAVKRDSTAAVPAGLLTHLATLGRWSAEFDSLEAELDGISKGLGATVRKALASANLVGEYGLVHRPQADSFADGNLLTLFAAADRKKRDVRRKLARLREWLEGRLAHQAQIISEVAATLAKYEQALPEAIEQGLADSFEVSADLVGVALAHLRGGGGVDSVSFIRQMLAIEGTDAAIPLSLSVHMAKLVKLLSLLDKFELDTNEARTLLTHPGLLFEQPSDLLHPTLTDLERLADFRRLKVAFNDDSSALLDLLDSDAIDLSDSNILVDHPWVRRISKLTGWEPRQLLTLGAALHSASGDPSSSTPDSMLNSTPNSAPDNTPNNAQSGRQDNDQPHTIVLLSRMKAGFDLAQSMDVSIDFPLQLARSANSDDTLSRQQANDLLQVLRAKVGEDDWPRIYKPLHDELAVKKRDALLAVALQRLPRDFAGRSHPDILYEFFLLDLQTGSEVDTSRIVQATASLQLYVQRCLMNLEAGVNPGSIPRVEWEWVKNYRVWEANRKVFLYPENFIEPELRKGKSPLFEELENNLAQVDIDQAAVEKAYVTYLDRFSELARLKIVGSYLHRDLEGEADSQNETLYLIGRTDTQPRIFHLRQQVKTSQGKRWLPWEKIDVAINADVATPVYAFGKLLLFWVEFTKLMESRARRMSEEFRTSPGSWGIFLRYHFVLWYSLVEDKATRKSLVDYLATASELTEGEITRLGTGEWSIDKEGYLYDNRLVGRVQQNVDVYRAEVKYSYYNFDKSWIPPQIYLEKKLTHIEYQDVRWHSLYAQQTQDFKPASAPKPPVVETNPKVLQIDDETRLAVVMPRFRMESLTWSFWLKRINVEPKGITGSSKPASNGRTLFEYDGGAVRVAVVNEFVAIAGAMARDDRVRAATTILEQVNTLTQSGQSEPAADGWVRLKALFDNPVDSQRNDTGWDGYVVTMNDAFANADPAITALQTYRAAQGGQAADIAAKKGIFVNLWTAFSPAVTSTRDSSSAQQVKERNAAKWESTTCTLRVSLSNATPTVSIVLNTDRWQHVALQFDRDDVGNRYDVSLIRHDVDETEGTKSQGFLPGGTLSQRATIELGNPTPIDGTATTTPSDSLFDTQLSELQFWSPQRSIDAIQNARLRLQRMRREPGNFTLPLNVPVEGADMELTASTNLTFTTPVAFGGDLSSRLSSRERIIVFYGDEIRSIRNNLEEQGFTLKSVPASAGRSYDADLTPAPSGRPTDVVLSLITTDGLFVSDAVSSADEGTTLTRSGSVLPESSVQTALPRSTDHAIGSILGKLVSREVTFLDVHNRPGWYLLDTGDDQFLVKSLFRDANGAEMSVPSAGELMNVAFDDAANTADRSTQAISVSFGLNESEAPAVGSVKKVEFRFERLSTYAIHELSKQLFTGGIDRFLSPASQLSSEINFESAYQPNPLYVPKADNLIPDTIDFGGSCRLYFEEIFFHIPFLIANRLNGSQRFEEAQKWYHYIFDPTVAPDSNIGPADNPNDRYWRYLPFRKQSAQSLDALLTNEETLTAYREDPFDPHAIAALRLTTYQKAVVMKYVDNLLDWGDSLFSQDTRESITEATLLYVLAFNLLGPRPSSRPMRESEDIGTYDQFIASHADGDIEFFTEHERLRPTSASNAIGVSPHVHLTTHFCVPENTKFTGYWDRVDDRLYKVRHSLNIEGVFRQLALFQPPIDPAALVAAVARGAGIGSALADVAGGVPHYRYGAVLEQANTVTAYVGELGAELLTALESRDDGKLAQLENTHTANLLKLVTTVKSFELFEAKETLEALRINRQNVDNRREFYRRLSEDGTEGLSLNAAEASSITFRNISRGLRKGVGIADIMANMAQVTPDVEFGASGFGGSPLATAEFGGDQLSAVFKAQGAIVDLVANTLEFGADMSQEIGEFQRRLEEWKYEKSTAELDLQEIDKQLIAAESGLARIEAERLVHDREVEQNREIGDYMRGKFTNGELRGWMVARLSGLYFQGYKLAHDLGKAAEKALQFELPTTQTFITPGHWDNLRKGLLAADSLSLELNRMDKVRLDQDSRFQEIEKTISIKRHYPEALAVLNQGGLCDFSLSERLFNNDFPGHYCRLLKTVALSIVVDGAIDPHDAVHASLSQSGNKTLLSPDSAAVGYLMGISQKQPDTSTLRVNWRANQQIAISRASEDLGMFNLDFVFDDRYFPFEGTGAVSSWQLEVPKENNRSLLRKQDEVAGPLRITDVIIHLRYTSKFDRGAFREEVRAMMAQT